MPLLLVLALTASIAHSPVAQQPPAQTPPKPAPGQTAPPTAGAPGAPAGAQAATPAAPARPQGPYEFTTDVGLFYVVVRNDKAAQFDAAMAKLKQAFAASDASADRKRQAAGWRVFKSSETATPPPTAATPAPPAGADAAAAATPPTAAPTTATISYIFMIEPVVKKVSYNPIEILSELLPNEVQATFEQLTGAIVSITRIGVTELPRMGGS